MARAKAALTTVTRGGATLAVVGGIGFATQKMVLGVAGGIICPSVLAKRLAAMPVTVSAAILAVLPAKVPAAVLVAIPLN